MTLSDLTSREAVLAAMREFDELGRDAFLQRYGFGRSSDYFVVHEGRRYDSKAIAGVAVGKQYPESGPLTHTEFSGGAETVVRKLRSMAFEVSNGVSVKFGKNEVRLLRASRRHQRYQDITAEERVAYEQIAGALDFLGQDVLNVLGGPTTYEKRLTSGYTTQSGVRGALPKDLWFGVHRRENGEAFAGNPQVFMIVSERGLEMGFAASTHPSDFSNSVIRERVRAAAPILFGLLPEPNDPSVEAFGRELQNRGWTFRRKSRLDPRDSDFGSLAEWLAYLKSPDGVKAAGGAISRYLTEDQLDTIDLEAEANAMAALFKPWMEMVHPGERSIDVVVREPDSDGAQFGALLQSALASFTEVRRGPFGEREPLWSLLNAACDRIRITRAVASRPHIKVKWSVGKGNWASSPWIALMDDRVTTSTQKGLYCVFLVAEDLSRVFLTLNQGMTELVREEGQTRAVEILTRRAAEYRARTQDLANAGFTLGSDIDLKTENWRARNYEPSTVAYVAFDAGHLPNDDALERLLGPLLIAYERLIDASPEQPRGVAEPTTEYLMPYTVDDAMEGVFMDRAEFERLLDVWRSRKNIVLQGAPGVGKSFIARRLAFALLAERDEARVEFVQFHQSYGYEDFVQGYRPAANGAFQLQDGIFTRFCKTAASDPHRPYVLIIDEINRGNLSKIFGELMLLLESDKRDARWALRLAYADDASPRFFVPSNLYVIGMMNTADRSLSMVDYALRRRFAFLTLRPAFAVATFRNHIVTLGVEAVVADRVIARMADLNEAIAEDKANLGPGYQIGHSFFVPTTQVEDAEGWYERVVDTEVRPLLEEYWFDDPRKAEGWVGRLLERT